MKGHGIKPIREEAKQLRKTTRYKESLMLSLSKKFLNQIIEHSRREYGREACGILTGQERKVEKIYPMENVAETPAICYMMKPAELLKTFKEIQDENMELLAIYHSHTGTSAYPSARDLELAFYPEVTHLIVSLQDADRPEIHGFKINENEIAEEKIEIGNNGS